MRTSILERSTATIMASSAATQARKNDVVAVTNSATEEYTNASWQKPTGGAEAVIERPLQPSVPTDLPAKRGSASRPGGLPERSGGPSTRTAASTGDRCQPCRPSRDLYEDAEAKLNGSRRMIC